jgi:sialidase-1
VRVIRRKTASSASIISSDVFTASSEHPRYSEGSILPLSDGTLMFAITEFDKDASDFAAARIVARRSRDGGRTWEKPEILQDNVGRLNVMSATLRRLRPHDGPTVGLFYLVKNSRDDLKAYFRASTDDGRTFGKPQLMTDAPGYHVINNDRVTELADGRLLCPIAWSSDVERDNHFVSLCYWSDDDGATWKTGKRVRGLAGHHRRDGRAESAEQNVPVPLSDAVNLPRRGAMEPEVVELNDGRVLMIVRTQLGEIFAAFSNDRGESWTKAEPWGVRSPESPATLRRIPTTGDLLLVWNPAHDAAASHGGKRTPLVAAVSTNEGRTWNAPRTLEDRTDQEYAYTSVAFLDRRVLISYYVADNSTGRISTRFRSLPIDWFYESATKN